jgi:ribosomal-protein-alanine N-acetyltransferase
VVEPTFHTLIEKHIDEIMEIERLSFTTPWSRMAFIHEIESPHSIFEVMTLNGRLVGYGGFWLIMDEAHISNIALHPDHRRKGLGRKLLARLLGQAVERGATKGALEVRPSNEAAQRLYDSFGFKAIAVRKNYYTDEREDALIMWNEDIPASLEGAKLQ